MLQLINSIALLGIATVIIPVLVHLWHVRKGKTLKVGSIALFTANPKQRASIRKIRNWPLLLLRCLLLILVSLLLAEPVWKQEPGKRSQHGWILIPVNSLEPVYEKYKSGIDSLIGAGYELRDFAPGFTVISLADTSSKRSFVNDSLPAISPWSLLKTLEEGVPEKFPVVVFSDEKLENYRYISRPVTGLAIQWYSFNAGDSFSRTPVYSYLATDGLRNIEKISTLSGNYYKNYDSSSYLLPVDTNSIRVLIYADDQVADGSYINAAVNAISLYTRKKIEIKSAGLNDNSTTTADFIFWLSDKPSPAALTRVLADKGSLFQYAPGGLSDVSTWLTNGNDPGHQNRNNIYRLTSSISAGEQVWGLANGEPLLTMQRVNGKRFFSLRTHLNPRSTDLVWEEDLAELLMPLIIESPHPAYMADNRTIDYKQVMPGRRNLVANKHNQQSLPGSSTNLSVFFWAAALMTFILERIVTHHKTQTVRNA